MCMDGMGWDLDRGQMLGDKIQRGFGAEILKFFSLFLPGQLCSLPAHRVASELRRPPRAGPGLSSELFLTSSLLMS